jgi:hypothetical protein
MITETLKSDLHRTVFFSDSALKIVFTTLYVDVKEPDQSFDWLKLGFRNLSFLPNSKRLFLLFIQR